MTGICLSENVLACGGWLFGVLLAIATFPCAAYLAQYGVRHRVRMLWLCIGLVVAGVVVYLLMGENPIGAMCDTVHSFFPSRGDFRSVPVKDTLGSGWKSWQSALYFLFHWSVLVYVLSIVLAVFGIVLVNWGVVCWRVLRHRPINVFWDYSNEAWNLADSMGRPGTKCADGVDSVV